ncbi:hypothetical protein RchiOBHm_Chr4g0417711 [Rosa chinensis]|uniref:Uncharacterized protein n=1 Tax=Rosa chinensis TaxID=74649 RepID=A0A2P6QX64_ROSCH|nr:hypothetical protein RchiOBHm_Chr4g0417711 [Rosa chinensis]
MLFSINVMFYMKYFELRTFPNLGDSKEELKWYSISSDLYFEFIFDISVGTILGCLD